MSYTKFFVFTLSNTAKRLLFCQLYYDSQCVHMCICQPPMEELMSCLQTQEQDNWESPNASVGQFASGAC